MSNSNISFVTVLSNKNYLPGVIALKNALDRHSSKIPLTVLIPNKYQSELIPLLQNLNVIIITRPFIFPKNDLSTQNTHYWSNTFFKIAAVSLTEYDKIVLIDCDMLIVQNIDHLFECPHLSAVVAGKYRYPKWIDLNSGLMVIKPNIKEFNTLVTAVNNTILKRKAQNLACGDQDVFHTVYPFWPTTEELHLPESYNTFFEDITFLYKENYYNEKNTPYIIHFIGKDKPWNYNYKKKIHLFLSCIKHRNFKPLKYLHMYLKLIKTK